MISNLRLSPNGVPCCFVGRISELTALLATAQLLACLTASAAPEAVTALLNCCGMGPKHYPQAGLPSHAIPLIQS